MKRNLEVLSFLRPLLIASAIIVILLRVYSSVALALLPTEELTSYKSFFFALLEDMWFLLLEYFFLLLIGIVLSRIYMPMAKGVLYVLVLLLLFLQIGFTEYFLTVHQLVDSTIYYFSMDELVQTVGLGERFTWPVVLGLLVILAVFIFTARFVKRKQKKPEIKTVYGTLLVGALSCIFIPMYSTTSEKSAVDIGAESNLMLYFVNSSLSYSAQETDIELARPADFKKLDEAFIGGKLHSDVYPLFRPLKGKSMLAKRMHKTASGKAPNVVFIIVEGLSSDLLGEQADITGHLMPFMDSLSKASLYYPNMLSTSQRTQNVLPSTLCSVPNVDEGSIFQQMHYPNHWSLMGLLKQTYQTRFYCGVPMEYMNMRGFMNQHSVDYLSDTWVPRVEREVKKLKSPWGVQDGELLNQFLYEKKKSNEPAFNVFLTISTHDPYIYPNKEQYTEFVKSRLNKIKGSKYYDEMMAKAEKFGAYSYLDDELKRFFNEMKSRPEYKETIFLITGDHGSEMWNRSVMSKFHVPFVVSSPMLKKPETIHTVVSHLDVSPTLQRYLMQEYKVKLPSEVPYIGKDLEGKELSKVNRAFIFTSSQLKNKDLFYKDIALIDDCLYRVGRNITLKKIDNPWLMEYLKKQRKLYRSMSRYTINQNYLIPPRAYEEYYKTVVWKQASKSDFKIPSGVKHREIVEVGNFGKDVLRKKRVRVTVKIETKLNRMVAHDSLPDLVIGSAQMKKIERKKSFYRLIRPTMLKQGKAGEPSYLTYEVVFDTRKVPKLKGVSRCYIYLYYKRANSPIISRAETVISTAD